MRTSFHHQSEAQPPNGPLTAATSPDTPSLSPPRSPQGFIFREPSTATIHIALYRVLPAIIFGSAFVVPAVAETPQVSPATPSLTYTETGSNGLHAWHSVRVLPAPPRSRSCARQSRACRAWPASPTRTM